jgi:hypothetical protein
MVIYHAYIQHATIHVVSNLQTPIKHPFLLAFACFELDEHLRLVKVGKTCLKARTRYTINPRRIIETYISLFPKKRDKRKNYRRHIAQEYHFKSNKNTSKLSFGTWK